MFQRLVFFLGTFLIAVTNLSYGMEQNAPQVGATKQDCSICLDPMYLVQVVHVLPCGHIFHHQCLEPWRQEHNTCPNCRAVIIKEPLIDGTPYHQIRSLAGRVFNGLTSLRIHLSRNQRNTLAERYQMDLIFRP
jgi:hypothetical protein